MIRLPSYEEADALALELERLAQGEAATAAALAQVRAGDPSRCIERVRLLRRAAEGWRWLADHSDRLKELEKPKGYAVKRDWRGGLG